MKKAFIGLVAVFLINLPSLYFGLYLRWGWVDVVLHFAGGFFVAMFMADYLKDRLVSGQVGQSTQQDLSARSSTYDISALIKNCLVVVGATVFVGVVWEFAEFIANQTLVEPFYRWFGIKAYFMGDLTDTVNDLLMDTLGALVFFSLVNRKK